LAHPQAPTGACDHIDGKCKEQAAADAARKPFGMFRKSLPSANFDAEAPNQDARRDQFDQAIEPEREQTDTACC
jgi:hypothetical protein